VTTEKYSGRKLRAEWGGASHRSPGIGSERSRARVEMLERFH
jgi:hypothetical protein